MNILDEIRNWNKKPKELIVFLAEKVKKDKSLVNQIIDCMGKGSDVEKGVCAETMEYVTKDKPELGKDFINTAIEYLNFDAPRVKWECARVIGNAALKYPDRVEKAIDKLFENTKDKGTVVRWSAAFGLAEIAKANEKLAKKLIPQFEKIIKKEQNSGVKNVYLKALKVISK